MQIGPPDWLPGTRFVLLATAVASLVQTFLPAWTWIYLVLPSLWYPWTLATALLFSSGVVPFLITAIMLMFFGNSVEKYLGRNRFLAVYFGFGAFGNAVLSGWMSAGGPALATTGSAFSIEVLFVAFGHFHRHASVLFMFLFPLNAWLLVKLGIGFNLLALVLTGSPVAGASLAVAGAALLYFTGGRRRLELWWTQAKLWWHERQRARKRSRFTVIQGGKGRDEEDPWVREDEGDGDPKPPVIH